MRRRRRNRLALALGLIAAATATGVGFGSTLAAFTGQTDNPANSVSAAPDFRAPQVGTTTVAKATGYDPGYVKQGGSYYVYANVTDVGNPPSGVASVTANAASLTAGQTAVPLAAGSFSVGGVSYNRRSAALTATNPLAAGSYSYSVASTDTAGNSGTQTGFGVTVDNTVPTASDIQTANGAATIGRAEQGDTITYTLSEPIDPQSILAGWTGAAIDVVVRINEGGAGITDKLLVYNSTNATLLKLGTVNLGDTGYVTANRTFGATGTKSRMVRSGNTITVTLGTASGAVTDPAATGTMIWTPVSTAYDRAGNAMTTATRNDSGTADKEF
jgi:hypothetical protein